MKQEIEVKVAIRDPAGLRERLRAAGAIWDGEADEFNIVWDRGGELTERGEALRLRRDRRNWLTWKGPVRFVGGLKEREEIQTPVADFEACRALLERLGYVPAVTYEKRREVWEIEGLELSIDVLAFGTFVEIEGDPEGIARVAGRLGLDLGAALSRNYLQLQADYQDGTLVVERFADA